MANIQELKEAADAMVARVQSDLAKLKTQAAQAQSKTSLSDDDQKVLDEITQKIAALDPTDPTTLDDSAPVEKP